MIRTLVALIVAILALIFSPRIALANDDAKGIAVLATDGATDATWPLARAIYGSELLRPANIDDRRARVLAGETPSSGFGESAELAELRAGVKGDDAASRQVLSAIAEKLNVASIFVVFAGDPPTARLFDAKSKTFDAASYSPDPKTAWDATIRSLERPFSPVTLVTPVAQVPVAPTTPIVPPKTEKKSTMFYESPWFWATIGAVLLIGGGILIATTVQTSDTIHMQLKLP